MWMWMWMCDLHLAAHKRILEHRQHQQCLPHGIVNGQSVKVKSNNAFAFVGCRPCPSNFYPLLVASAWPGLAWPSSRPAGPAATHPGVWGCGAFAVSDFSAAGAIVGISHSRLSTLGTLTLQHPGWHSALGSSREKVKRIPESRTKTETATKKLRSRTREDNSDATGGQGRLIKAPGKRVAESDTGSGQRVRV